MANFKKIIFTAIAVLILSLSVLIGITEAATPPAGCSGSHWDSSTKYVGYYECKDPTYSCPGPVSGWTQTSKNAAGRGTYGCCSVCLVTEIVWESTSPSSSPSSSPPPPPCVPSGCPGGCADTGQSRGCGLFCPNSSGTACNDGNACTNNDKCSGGSCSGTQVAPSCSLSFSPSSVNMGDPSTLSWSANCANSGSINNGWGSSIPFPSGSKTIYPVSNLTYTMTVNGSGGSATCPSAQVAVTIPAGPKCNDVTDVMIAFDTTASMGGEILAAQTQAMAIMNLLDSRLGAGNVEYGVIEFRDYADGAPYPYMVRQAITPDKNSVQASLNSLIASGGADTPEAQSRVMYESYNDSAAFGWRSSAQKFLIMITDTKPHDKDTAQSIDPAYSGPNYYDPKAGISSDAIANNMKANKIVLITLDAGGNSGVWGPLAQTTGGSSYSINANPATLAQMISNAVLSVVGDKDNDGHFSNACGGDDCNDNISGQYAGQSCFKKCFDNELKNGTCQGIPGNVECVYATGTECAKLGDICNLDSCVSEEGTADDHCAIDTGGNICGGLVPCGRLVNAPPPPGETIDLIDESKPCDLCAAFYMLKKIINFATELALGIAIFVIVIAGLIYVFSSGEPAKIELAKSAITYALTGLALVFAAWLVIAIILQSLGYADINTWNQVNCNLQK